jgi:hypothetical protein
LAAAVEGLAIAKVVPRARRARALIARLGRTIRRDKLTEIPFVKITDQQTVRRTQPDVAAAGYGRDAKQRK